MLGQDIAFVEAEVQAKVAEFLLLKKKLIALESHPDAKVQDRAKVLLGVQNYLEGKLASVLDIINRAKTMDIGAGDITEAGLFAYAMKKQLDDVEDLEKDAGYIPQEANIIPMALAAAVGIGLGIMLLKRR